MPGESVADRLEAVRLQGLALLREPADAATMIRPLRAGETVTVYEQSGDYVKVTTKDGTQGYVHGGFLTGFDDIAPIKAYASRIDPGVTRPPQDGKKAASVAAEVLPASRTEAATPPSPRIAPVYAPVADGGGLELYIATVNRLSASGEAAEQAKLVTDFNAAKNRYSIEVHLSERKLYLYENLPNGSRLLAKAYVVAVPGRDMEAPQGWGVVTGISFEPWWRPTSAMKERALKKGKTLPEVVRPGVRENPMGPFKIILSHGFGFRIHGNNNPGSIGRPVTSGCIRMRNEEGKDLAKMIDVGTEVVFLE
jgi:lipoprotein-anchoring transpeptidase ErfK/SrfK